MVGNPFSGGVFTPFLCTRIPFTIRVVQPTLQQHSLTEIWMDDGKKVKVQEMGNDDLRTDVE